MQVFSPRNETVLVLRDDSANDVKTDGGLYIPNRAVELSNQGEVRAVGPNSQYEVGQRVVFTKYAGSELALNNVPYILLKEKEIQGVIYDAPGTDTLVDKEAQLQVALAQFERTKQG